MRPSTRFLPVVLLFATLAAAILTPVSMAAGQQRPTSSQQRIVDRIHELKAEIEELLAQLPEDMRGELRRQLAEAPAAPVAVTPVGPVRREIAPAPGLLVAGFRQVLVLDLRHDGLDLGGEVTVVIDDNQVISRWTRPGTDDAFLAVRPDSLRDAGIDLKSADGRPLHGLLLLSDGIVFEGPDRKEVRIIDAWHLLSQFDSNNDGLFDRSDRAWSDALLLVDINGDGVADDSELSSLADGGVAGISLRRAGGRSDAYGNVLSLGTFTAADGRTGTAAGAALRR